MMKWLSWPVVMLTVILSGCSLIGEKEEPQITRQFSGSDMTPDPVLEQVQVLTKAGVLKNVRMTRSIPATITATGPKRVLACLSSPGGRWLQDQQECEYLSEASCQSLGGAFNACASACRHDSAAMVCVLMCVPVCRFGK